MGFDGNAHGGGLVVQIQYVAMLVAIGFVFVSHKPRSHERDRDPPPNLLVKLAGPGAQLSNRQWPCIKGAAQHVERIVLFKDDLGRR